MRIVSTYQPLYLILKNICKGVAATTDGAISRWLFKKANIFDNVVVEGPICSPLTNSMTFAKYLCEKKITKRIHN